MMLIELKNEGFVGNLTGIDYSPNAIELAKNIAIDRDYADIAYKVGDILSNQFVLDFGQFDVIHDKGKNRGSIRIYIICNSPPPPRHAAPQAPTTQSASIRTTRSRNANNTLRTCCKCCGMTTPG